MNKKGGKRDKKKSFRISKTLKSRSTEGVESKWDRCEKRSYTKPDIKKEFYMKKGVLNSSKHAKKKSSNA